MDLVGLGVEEVFREDGVVGLEVILGVDEVVVGLEVVEVDMVVDEVVWDTNLMALVALLMALLLVLEVEVGLEAALEEEEVEEEVEVEAASTIVVLEEVDTAMDREVAATRIETVMEEVVEEEVVEEEVEVGMDATTRGSDDSMATATMTEASVDTDRVLGWYMGLSLSRSWSMCRTLWAFGLHLLQLRWMQLLYYCG